MRVGHGYDVHRLVRNRKLILGGVLIPHAKGLDGHSDADVVAHAVTDSILGACGLGDIGSHFPDTDPQYKNANSLELLAHCVQLLKEHGYTLSNLDVTILAQQPKLAPYLPKMRENLATVFRCSLQQVNIKATTEERLGFTGQEQGIATHAVCLIQRLNG